LNEIKILRIGEDDQYYQNIKKWEFDDSVACIAKIGFYQS